MGRNCETPVVDCGYSYCANGGVCSDDSTCECPDNFIGATCENAIELCPLAGSRDGMCLNGGRCSRTSEGKAMCECPAGFSGASCEDEVIECSAEQWCVRGHGVCTSGHDSHCLCYDDWLGEHCQQSVAADKTVRTGEVPHWYFACAKVPCSASDTPPRRFAC